MSKRFCEREKERESAMGCELCQDALHQQVLYRSTCITVGLESEK